MPTARDEDFRSIADLRGWISSQLRVLTRFWYVTLGVVAVTSVALYVALISYRQVYVAEKQFVSVKANSNVLSGVGLSALGLGSLNADPLNSGKGIVTVALSQRILYDLLQTAGPEGATTLTEALLAVHANDPSFAEVLVAADTLSGEALDVAMAGVLHEASVLDADFDLDTEFVTLTARSLSAKLSERMLTDWYAVLSAYYEEQLYGKKSDDLAILQGKADSLKNRIAYLERSSETFQDKYQNLVRRRSELPLKTIDRESMEVVPVYRAVLENLELLRLNVETAAPVFADLSIETAYAKPVVRPTLRYLFVWAASTVALLGAALYLLPRGR